MHPQKRMFCYPGRLVVLGAAMMLAAKTRWRALHSSRKSHSARRPWSAEALLPAGEYKVITKCRAPSTS